MIANLIPQFFAAFIATVSFSLLFGVPFKYSPFCGLIGSIGWILHITIASKSSPPVAAFFATVVIILLSRWFAVRKRCPVTIFLISGIIPLVPSVGIYWASYYTVTDQLSKALSTGMSAFKVVVAIVLGIVFVFELPQSLFHIGLKKED